jgi:hypothetical protein
MMRLLKEKHEVSLSVILIMLLSEEEKRNRGR